MMKGATEVHQGTNAGKQEIILAAPKFVLTEYADVHRIENALPHFWQKI